MQIQVATQVGAVTGSLIPQDRQDVVMEGNVGIGLAGGLSPHAPTIQTTTGESMVAHGRGTTMKT